MRTVPGNVKRAGIIAGVAAACLLGASDYLPASESSVCGWCIDAEVGGGPGHYFNPGGTYWLENPHTTVATGSCGTAHSACGTTPSIEVVQRWSEQAAAGRMDGIEAFARAHPDKIVLNAARGALQIKGCQGEIMVHIPLTAAQLESLAE